MNETAIQKQNGNVAIDPKIIQSLVLEGDISKMSTQQRVEYYTRFCEKLGLNPLTQPFMIIKFQGKEKFYATKDCTEQLRKIHCVSVIESTTEKMGELLIVKVKVSDADGRTDVGTGVVVTQGLNAADLANAYMKCETKAKRRATLSICGLGILDESETDTIGTFTVDVINLPAEQWQLDAIDYKMELAKLDDKTRNQLKVRLANGMTQEEANKALAYIDQFIDVIPGQKEITNEIRNKVNAIEE